MSAFKDVIYNQQESRKIDSWNGTVIDYLYLVKQQPEIAIFAPGRIYNMLIKKGYEDVDESFKLRGYDDLVKYNFFDGKIFGTLEPTHDIMRFLKASARRTETGKRILILVGPVSSGKSTIAALLKRGLEEDDTPKYVLANCPIHEEPLHAIPLGDREYWQKELNVKIEGTLCPYCQYQLDNEFTMDGVVRWDELPVKRLQFSEQKRMGIGTFQPSDPKSQDVTELIGRVNMSKVARYNETDPRAFQFDGELQVANGGLVEMVELLKTDIKLQYVLISLAQEQVIKSPGFPQIYIDTLILAHSVVGNEPVPFRKNGKIGFKTIKELKEDNNLDIEVIAMNLSTKTPEWTKVVGFHSHYFTGNLIKTIQKQGIIETTYNHSIYSDEYKCFYPEEKKNILAIRQIPASEINDDFHLNISNDMEIEDNHVRIRDVVGNQGNGMFRKNKIKYKYNQSDIEDLKNILAIIAWYITEGHVTDNEVVISQQNIEILKDLKIKASDLTSTKLYFQDRSDAEDKTSRLRFPSTVWSRIMENNCGRYSENKRIPDFVFNLSNKFKEFFIFELLKGDGEVFVDRYIKAEGLELITRHFRYKTISKMLAAQLSFLLSQLNIDHGVTHAYTKNGYDAYNVYSRNNINEGGGNKIEINFVEDTEVFDIECNGNHSFVAGVGGVVCHNTNQTEFDIFKSDKKNEALHDRMYPVFVPWNLRVDDEIKIYEKMINESDFRDIHIAPHTLKVAAQFAVLSRLSDSSKVSNKIEKMKLYNGEVTENFKKSEIDVKAVRQEGKDNGEGMFGISPRFIINALNVALGSKEDKKCVNPIDIIRYLRDNFNHHIGIVDEDKERFLNILIGDKDSVSYEYKEVAKKEVNMAFLYAYEEQAQTLFENYMRNITAFCRKEKVFDSITGEYSDPDEKLMRSIEELIPVPENSKSEFRNGIFVHKSYALEKNNPFTYNEYPPLKDAIEKKLMSDLKSVVSLSLADTSSTDPKAKRRRTKALDNLTEKGYCRECANVLLSFIGEILRREDS